MTRDPSAAIVWQVLHVLLDDTVDDTDIRNLFLKCVCSTAVPQIGRFLPKKQKASSEECWVCTHIHMFLKLCATSLMDLSELRLCLLGLRL